MSLWRRRLSYVVSTTEQSDAWSDVPGGGRDSKGFGGWDSSGRSWQAQTHKFTLPSVERLRPQGIRRAARGKENRGSRRGPQCVPRAAASAPNAAPPQTRGARCRLCPAAPPPAAPCHCRAAAARAAAGTTRAARAPGAGAARGRDRAGFVGQHGDGAHEGRNGRLHSTSARPPAGCAAVAAVAPGAAPAHPLPQHRGGADDEGGAPQAAVVQAGQIGDDLAAGNRGPGSACIGCARITCTRPPCPWHAPSENEA